jgi:hypothetical protein
VRRRRSATGAVVVALLVGIAAATIAAAEPVGSVTALDGEAFVQHAGAATATPLAAGDPVSIGDQLRTAAGARMKLLFRDDSVLTLASSSTLVVTEAVAGVAAPVSRFGLLVGTVRAVVGERYGEPGARFDTDTPTAVAGVHGTSFVARYDAGADESVFVGLIHVTCVRAIADTTRAHEVCLQPGQTTRVARNALPTPAAPASATLMEELDAATTVVPAPVVSATENATEPGANGPPAGAATPGPAPRDGLATPPQGSVDQPIPLIESERKPPPPPPPLPQQPRRK